MGKKEGKKRSDDGMSSTASDDQDEQVQCSVPFWPEGVELGRLSALAPAGDLSIMALPSMDVAGEGICSPG